MYKTTQKGKAKETCPCCDNCIRRADDALATELNRQGNMPPQQRSPLFLTVKGAACGHVPHAQTLFRFGAGGVELLFAAQATDALPVVAYIGILRPRCLVLYGRSRASRRPTFV